MTGRDQDDDEDRPAACQAKTLECLFKAYFGGNVMHYKRRNLEPRNRGKGCWKPLGSRGLFFAQFFARLQAYIHASGHLGGELPIGCITQRAGDADFLSVGGGEVASLDEAVDGGFAEGFTKLNHVFRRNMIALQLAADGADIDASSSGRLSGQGGARQA